MKPPRALVKEPRKKPKPPDNRGKLRYVYTLYLKVEGAWGLSDFGVFGQIDRAKKRAVRVATEELQGEVRWELKGKERERQNFKGKWVDAHPDLTKRFGGKPGSWKWYRNPEKEDLEKSDYFLIQKRIVQ